MYEETGRYKPSWFVSGKLYFRDMRYSGILRTVVIPYGRFGTAVPETSVQNYAA